MIGGHWLEVVFWSPARGGQTTRNMKILANIYRIRYGMQVRTFENYEAYGKYHFMENMQKQNRQRKVMSLWIAKTTGTGRYGDFFKEPISLS